jgi:hypothetical protein
MTDKRLTDEEIIEALDLCTQQNGSIPCYDCQCWNDDEQECKGIDYTATLDLIKRQKAEIDSAKAKIEICAEVIERQDAEIKRVKECPKCVYEYDCEIKEYCVQGPCSNFKTVEQIKAEAYKEFAERIRECCNSNNELSADAWLSVTTDINCVLKEMVGEEE